MLAEVDRVAVPVALVAVETLAGPITGPGPTPGASEVVGGGLPREK